MFIMSRSKSRKVNRNRSSRYRAKLKAKNKARQSRVYQVHRRLEQGSPAVEAARAHRVHRGIQAHQMRCQDRRARFAVRLSRERVDPCGQRRSLGEAARELVSARSEEPGRARVPVGPLLRSAHASSAASHEYRPFRSRTTPSETCLTRWACRLTNASGQTAAGASA